MNRELARIPLLVVVCYAAAWAQVSAQPKPKLAELNADLYENHVPAFVFVDGVWEPDNPTKQNELVPAAVHFACHRNGGRVFVGTDEFCLVATAALVPGTSMLQADVDWLKVIEWSATQIIAVDESPICLTSQTIFDLKSKTVIALDVRKRDAKGFLDACKLLPDRQTYYLRERVDYWLNHKSDRVKP